MSWRYDPIFISEKYTVEYHIKAFENIAKRLFGYTKTAVISFIDLYPKVQKNFPQAQELAPFGADCSGCQTIEVLENALGKKT